MLLTNSFSTGGVETHILSLAEGLALRGYFVAVASAGGTLEKELQKRGILHIYLPLDKRALGHILMARKLLIDAVKTYRFDILHAHTRLAAFVVSLLPKRLGCRFVTTAHLDFSMTPLTRFFSRWGERVLAVSEDIRAYLVREYALSYPMIALTVNGIDTARFCQKNKKKDPSCEKMREKVILHVSRMDKDRAKTAFLLCDAMASLREKLPVTLILVGGGELLPALKRRVAEDAFLKDCVLVVGEAVDVLPYLQNADLFVGVSRAALEAMSCAVPTILSGNSGYLGVYLSEKLAKASASNFCCRDADAPTVKALCRDILRLLGDEAFYQKASQDCRETVLSYYSLDKMLQDYEGLYSSLCGRKTYCRNLILGYHGFDNLGDDLLLEKMIKGIHKIDPEGGVTVISQNAKATADAFMVGAVSRKNLFAMLKALFTADVLYVGGGTVLQKETSRRSFYYYAFWISLAKLMGKRVVYYANGLGEFSKREEKTMARLFKGKCVVTLRDKASYALAKRLCDEMPKRKRPYLALTQDPALTLQPLSSLEANCLFSAHRLRTDLAYFVLALSGKDRNKNRESSLKKAILLACEKGFSPILLLLQPRVDAPLAKALSEFILAKIGYKIPIVTLPARGALSLVASARFLIASRFHALLFAAMTETPFLCLSNSEKCRRFCYETQAIPSLLPRDWNEECLLYALTLLMENPCRFVSDREAVKALSALAQNTPESIRTGLLMLDEGCHVTPIQFEKKNREI